MYQRRCIKYGWSDYFLWWKWIGSSCQLSGPAVWHAKYQTQLLRRTRSNTALYALRDVFVMCIRAIGQRKSTGTLATIAFCCLTHHALVHPHEQNKYRPRSKIKSITQLFWLSQSGALQVSAWKNVIFLQLFFGKHFVRQS